MNTRPPFESPDPPVVLSVSFNTDATFFAIGLDRGFCVLDSSTCEAVSSTDCGAGIGLVQLMGRTNFYALVGGGRQPKFAQNKVMLWDDEKGKVEVEISTLTSVRGVRLSKTRVIVVLQNSVRVYSFARRPDLLAKYETADNLLGLCDMSEKMIVFPGRTSGQVQLVEIATGNVSIIPAHSAPLVAIRLSPDGELLATASEKGTIIRVFATSNCARVAELRRGWDQATIFSLGFSPSGTMLACTSDKGTMHIYDVPHPSQPRSGIAGAGVGVGVGGGSKSPTSPSFGPNALPGGGESSKNQPDEDGKGKWGILGKIPLMPRYFSDVVSWAQVPFYASDVEQVGGFPLSEGATFGTGPRPPKGIIGWTSEDSLVVIGAGRDPRWERYNIVRGEDGRRVCAREGFKWYVKNV